MKPRPPRPFASRRPSPMRSVHGGVRPVILLAAGLAAAALLFGAFRMVLHRVVADQLQIAARQIPGCNGMRYRTLTIPYLSLQCDVRDVRLLFAGMDDTIFVQALHIRRFRPGTPFPRILEAAVRGVVLAAGQPALAPLEEDLRTLALDTLTLDGTLQWTREGEKEERWRVALALQAAGTGKMAFRLDLDKVNPRGVALALESPLNWLLVLPPMALVAAGGRYEDRGWVERVLSTTARRQGRSLEEVRKAFVKTFQARSQAARAPEVRAFWQALADFSRRPGRLSFQTRLPRPLPLGELLWMRDPAAIVRGLALEVETHPRSLPPTPAPAGRSR